MLKNLKFNSARIAITLVVINFAVRGMYLQDTSIGGDEHFSIYHAQMDIASIIRLLSEGNNPPLYEIILHYWIELFGISEYSVRFPSLIFSCISVFYIFRLANKFLNLRIAVFSSVIYILSNYHTLFAHQARVYTLLGLLSIMSMYYYLDLINIAPKNKKKHKGKARYSALDVGWLKWIAVNSVLVYAHYFGFYILLTQLLFFLSRKELVKTYWKPALISSSIVALLYLPNIYVFLKRFLDSTKKGTWVEPPNGLDTFYDMIRQFSNAPVVAVAVIVIFVFAIVKYFRFRGNGKKDFNRVLIVFWFAFIFLFMFLVSYRFPMFIPKYLMPAAIAFSLVLAIAMDYLTGNLKYKHALPIFMCLLFTFSLKPNVSNKRNVREVVENIEALKKENTLVIICPKHFLLNFIYYYDHALFKNYYTDNINFKIGKELEKDQIYGVDHINEVDYKNFDHIVYLSAAADFSFPNNNIRMELDTKYEFKRQHDIYQIFQIREYNAID